MLLTNHVLSGALIGSLVRRPAPAFVAGVVSHFALDAVPHWGPFRERRALLRVAVPDGLTALAVLTAFAAAAPPRRRLALTAAMLGAALPDADKPAHLLFGRSPFPRAVGRFHSRIQDESLDRFPVEAATAAVLALAGIVAQATDRRANRPSERASGQTAHRAS
ncbi:MAG TPA: hypothetical protein VHW06_16605 [Streptosporangiaceae bacterium]|jgi:hypothetical protein|nr:hypothetical protein [Streptosporangiaceae bacterium]